jgi:hypothetical protein
MASAQLIDLGEIGPPGAAAEVPSRPALSRTWRSVLAVVVLLAAVGASARAPGGLDAHGEFELGPGRYAVIGDTLYLLPDSATGGATAYDVTTGTPRWHVPAAGSFERVQHAAATAVFGPDSCSVSATGTGATVAVDVASGRERWRRTGSTVSVIGQAHTGRERPLVIMLSAMWVDRCVSMLTGEARPLREPARFDGVLADSGVARWTVLVERGSRLVLGAGVGDGPGGGTAQIAGDGPVAGSTAAWAAVVTADDRVRVLDLGTGTFGPPLSGVATHDDPRLAGVGDLLLVSRLVEGADGGASEVLLTAYRVTTHGSPGLDRRWSVRLAVSASGAGTDPLSYFAVAGCGPLVCVVADDTVALDPGTGAVRWRAEPVMFTDVPGGLIADFGWARRSSRPTVLAVADPRTGETLATHQGWRLLGVDTDRGRLLVGRIGASTTELAWLDGSALNSIRPIDLVGDLFESCRATRLFLACRSQRGAVRTWRLRP